MSHRRWLVAALLLCCNSKAQEQPLPQILTVCSGDQIVALATEAGRPLARAQFTLRWWRDRTEQTASYTADAMGLVRIPRPAPTQPRTPVLEVRGRHGHALAAIVAPPSLRVESVAAHVMVDRPLYRPGELVRGRVLLREVGQAWAGDRVEVGLLLPSGREVCQTAHVDVWGNAGFELALPDDAAGGELWLQVRIGAWACRQAVGLVAAFKRPSLTCAIAPLPVVAPHAGVDVDIRAAFAAGGPAAHQRGLLKLGDTIVPFQLDLAGSARVAIDRDLLAALRARAGRREVLDLQASVVGPDGVAALAERELPLVEVAAAPVADAPAVCAPGQRLVVPVRGAPHELGLVLVAHQQLLAARAVQLDAAGHARVEFEVAPAWQKRVQITALGTTWPWRVFRAAAGEAVTVAVMPELQVEMRARRVGEVTPAQRFAPGDEVELEFAVGLARSDGLVPCAATLGVAVVDEQVFALRDDCTLDPREALAPRLARDVLALASSRAGSTRGRALLQLFHDGLLDGWPVLAARNRRAAAGGPATPGPAGAVQSERDVVVRRRFAATAAFFPAVATDAAGRARVRLRLPDDVTTWRVTVAAVSGAAAALHRGAFSTQKDLALGVAVPRFLRVGDELLGARLLHRGDAPPEPRPLRLRAERLGELPIDLEAREGDRVDRLRTGVPVREAVARAPWSVASTSSTAQVLSPPAELPSDATCELVVLADRAAILAQASEFLGEYPYGCVEQTTSKLLPHLVALRVGGGRDAERAAKIDAGLRRLRELSVAPDRGFAYWPGWRAVDAHMTPYVLSTLALAKASGIDLARHGLEPWLGSGDYARLLRRLGDAKELQDDEFDLAVALASFGGADGAHARALAARGDLARWSPQRCARAAQVLAAEVSRALLLRALAQVGDDWSTDDLAQAVSAGRRVMPGAAPIAQLELRLLARQRDGRFGHTQATAAAVLALAGDGQARAGREVVVDVAQGDQTWALRCGSDGRAHLRLPRCAPVTVTAHAGAAPVVLLRGTRPVRECAVRPGTTFRRWLRDLDSGREIRRFLAVGQRVELVVELADARPRARVVIDCPLPAGFEVVSAGPGWDVQDDRVVFALAETSPVPQRATLELRPAFVGEVSWPAALASAMYDDAVVDLTGGESLTILPR